MLPHCVRSYLWADCELGSAYENPVLCEDLTRLTFADNACDLIITSHVMGYVPRYELALSEIFRVLKPSGTHVFSVPPDFPISSSSEPRCIKVSDEIIHVKTSRYHNSRNGTDCLTYVDYGLDLLKLIDKENSVPKIF